MVPLAEPTPLPAAAAAGPARAERVRALVSVHDLMPASMPAVHATLALLERLQVAPVTLLVVPGAGWDRAGIATLRTLEAAGYRLAGHGWQHRVTRIRGAYHRLHSLLLSRRVAEHLALDADAILGLLARCQAWFGDQGLRPPTLYVPPAWALGAVPRQWLGAAGPFPLYEVFRGVIAAPGGQLQTIPLLGYEADRALRVPAIRLWNAVNRRRAAAQGLVRIAIHPQDPSLRLGADLRADLARYRHRIDYADLLPAPAGAASGSSSSR